MIWKKFTPVRGVILLCVICLAVAAYAAYYCPPFSDEGHYSDGAYNLSHHGFLGITFWENVGTGMTRLNKHSYVVMPLYMVAQAAWMLIMPDSLFSIRLFGLVWMVVSIFAVYALARAAGFTQGAALATILVYSSSFVLIDGAKDARPDLMCQALGWSGLAAYVALRDRSLTVALVVANAFVAASGLTHPNGLLYFAGLTAMVLFLDASRLRWAEAAAVAGTYAVAAVCWGAFVLQDPQAFLDQFLGEASIHHATSSFLSGTGSVLFLPARVLWAEIDERYLATFGLLSRYPASRLKGLVLAAYLAALVAVVVSRSVRRNPAVKLFLLLLLVFFGMQCVFNAKYIAYFVHILPIYSALLGFAIWHLWVNQSRLRPLLALCVTGLIVLQLGFMIGKARSLSRRDDISDARTFLQKNCGAARLIFADASLLHTLQYDPRFLDDRYFGVRSGKRAGVIVELQYLEDNIYGTLRQVRPGDWTAIRERLSEYQPVFVRPGLRILSDSKSNGCVPMSGQK